MERTAYAIREEFDRIARLSQDGWDHNSHYHRWLIERLPFPCSDALDIGCGAGAFSRLLAQRSERVVAIDLAPEMIRLAKERSAEYANIEFEVADVMSWDLPVERFDCIASIATLHHLPFEEMLIKMRAALRPGGVILILDLFEPEVMRDHLSKVIALPVSGALRWMKQGRIRQDKEARQAWAEHALNDSFLTVTQARRACDKIIPGAKVRKHLLWRYSVVWKKLR